MSSLSENEKRYLENLLDMGDGYVLDFTDATFGDFFRQHDIDIHGADFQTYGTSKAKKMRAFWDQEPDSIVAEVLSEMMDIYETNCTLRKISVDIDVLERVHSIVARLSGKPEKISSTDTDVAAALLKEEFANHVASLPIKQDIVPIIESRIDDVGKTLRAGAFLSTVVMCGSILEAILLGKTVDDPAGFNRSTKAAKHAEGKVKPFREWTLSQLIDVASELGYLKPDIRRFGHALREFRNYIHPHQQMRSGFMPDEHTARMCVDVLMAALASIAGKR